MISQTTFQSKISRKMEHLSSIRSKSVDKTGPQSIFQHQQHMTNLAFESFANLCHRVSFHLVRVAFKCLTCEMLPHLLDLFFHCDLCFLNYKVMKTLDYLRFSPSIVFWRLFFNCVNF